MTAVEWLIEQLEWDDSKIARVIGLKKYNQVIKQAKEMEKQQSYSEEEVKDIMAETWIRCVGNDGNDFKELRDKILEQFINK